MPVPRCRTRLASIGLVVLFALASFSAAPQVIDLSKFPDITAQWRRPEGIGIQWDQAKRPGRTQQAPLTPQYQVLYEANLADQAAGGQGADPTGKCIPPGMPRMMTIVFPMEIIVLPAITYILTDYTEPRRIFTDGRDWPKDMEPTFNGYSIGRWVDEDGDGRFDALEVETRSFKNPRTFEASGIQLHEDGATIIRERIFLDRSDRNILHDEIATIDNALTRPWTVIKNYRREPNPVWHFNDCDENNHHVWIGKENYYVSADGYLMPVKKDQPPPDLRYFNQRR